MKFSIWAYTVVLGVSVYVFEMIARAFPGLYQPMAVDKPPPWFTEFLLENRLLVYAIPAVWVIAAILAGRKSGSANRRSATFVTASIFVIAIIYGAVIAGFVMPLCNTMKELSFSPQ